MDPVLSSDGEAAGLAALEALAVQEAALFAAVAVQLYECAVRSEREQGPDGPDRFLVLELAGTMRTGQLAAGHRLTDARRLVLDLPGTLAALQHGVLLVAQARIVLAETLSCAAEVAAEVDRRLVAQLGADPSGWTGRRLRSLVKRLVMQVEAQVQPALTEQRLESARRGRRVSVRPAADGMGSLWALLTAEQLRAFSLGMDELHRRQVRVDRDAQVERTADQRRADLLAVLPALALHALDGTAPAAAPGGCGTHPSVVLHVHVPVATALDLGDAPGSLDGYGPISAAHTRLLLPLASLRRVLVDAVTGQPLHTDTPDSPAGRRRTGPAAQRHAAGPGPLDGAAAPPGSSTARFVREQLLAMLPDQPLVLGDQAEEQYEPSDALARLVRLRDPLCTGPGCATSSTHSDLDHEVPWPTGPTAARNLRPRSRRCHRAKTVSWTVQRHADGSHLWTGPSGRSYPVPAYWDPPAEPGRPPRDPRSRPAPVLPDNEQTITVPSLTADLDARTAEVPAAEAPARRGRAPSPPAQDDPSPF